MRRYDWNKDGVLLKELLDSGARVICIDDDDRLSFAEKVSNNEYVIGTHHIFPNGSKSLSGYPFIEPEEYMPSEYGLPKQKNCKGQFNKLNETQKSNLKFFAINKLWSSYWKWKRIYIKEFDNQS